MYTGGDMAEYLINFVNYLDPNGQSLQSWPKYNNSNPKVLTFLDGLEPLNVTTDSYRKEPMDLLTELSQKYPL